MNICLMTNTYLPHVGGVARSVSTCARSFHRQGHGVLVIAPAYDEPAPEDDEALVERVVAIKRFNHTDFSVRLPFATACLTRLRQFAPDVVHSHHPFLLGENALRLSMARRVPLVFTHHTRYEDYLHYLPFEAADLKTFVTSLCTDYANHCDAVIAPSASAAARLKAHGVLRPIEVIPTGIDTARFARGNGAAFRCRLGIPDDAFVIGTVGRLAPEKNLEYLAQAAARALRRLPSAHFLVAGDGPDGPSLRRILEEAGVGGRIHLCGTLDGANLVNAYHAMSAFAFSSLTETQGLVLAEAMAAGLPVVALKADGVRDVMTSGVGLMLETTASPEMFARALLKLAQEPGLRTRMSGLARRVATRYDHERCAQGVLDVYREAVRRYRVQRSAAGKNPLKSLRRRLSVEWKLIANKAKFAVKSLPADMDLPEVPLC
jgi:glycosyltransferase involved in cell wall biosynthesis